MEQRLHPDDEPLSCTQSDIDELRRNRAWQDIEKALEEATKTWQAALRQADSLPDVKKAQATLDAIDYMLSLPDQFSEEIEQLDVYE